MSGAAPGMKIEIDDSSVVVVGAGLAGLACAAHLAASGCRVTVLEAGDGVGGRVRSDLIDGFTCDRGFQVLCATYPSVAALLDVEELDPHRIAPAVAVMRAGHCRVLGDPFAYPGEDVRAIRDGLVTPRDVAAGLVLVATSLWRTRHAPGLPSRSGSFRGSTARSATIAERVRRLGFSPQFRTSVLEPLLSGVLLDPALGTSASSLDFLVRHLLTGRSVLPARGMQAVPDQLAARLAPDSIALRRRVAAVGPRQLTTEDGRVHRCVAVVVATEGPEAVRLLRGRVLAPRSVGAACVYLAAELPPVDVPAVVIDGERTGPVASLLVSSNVAPSLAPPGAALLAVAVTGSDAKAIGGDHWLVPSVREHLGEWFGRTRVRGWRHLATYRIAHALPAQPPGWLAVPQRPVRIEPGLYVCGDHRDNASIEGALRSGQRAAEAVLSELAVAAS